jgi:hypothetical protein
MLHAELYRAPQRMHSGEWPGKIISFLRGVRFPKVDLSQVLLGHSGHESEVNIQRSIYGKETIPATVSRVGVLRLFDWRRPVLRMSTSLLALCCQSGPDAAVC